MKGTAAIPNNVISSSDNWAPFKKLAKNETVRFGGTLSVSRSWLFSQTSSTVRDSDTIVQRGHERLNGLLT